MSDSFILASLSPRRRQLLGSLGLRFTVVPSGVEESRLDGESPRDHVMRLSREKAFHVAGRYPDSWVLGADTIVVVDGTILGKPGDPDEARAMLRRLSGREHMVITGFSIVNRKGGVAHVEAVETSVLFRDLDNEEIEWYIKGDEPYDKAGGYAFQGGAGCFVQSIRGSASNVIGLPLAEVVAAMKRLGVVRLDAGEGGMDDVDNK